MNCDRCHGYVHMPWHDKTSRAWYCTACAETVWLTPACRTCQQPVRLVDIRYWTITATGWRPQHDNCRTANDREPAA